MKSSLNAIVLNCYNVYIVRTFVYVWYKFDVSNINNNTINDFLCANILEDQAQWRDKTKGLRNLVIVNNARVVDGWMKALGS